MVNKFFALSILFTFLMFFLMSILGLHFFFLICMPQHIPCDLIDYPSLTYLYIIGSISPWLGSCIYHLLMNHKSEYELYTQLLKWDVISILITQSFGESTTIYTSFALYPLWLKYIFVFINTFFAIRALQ